MAYMNRVFLAGNLTRDPEIRRLPSGIAVAKIGLAVSRKFRAKTGEDKEEVCFVDIEAWDRLAENCEKYLRKGAPILVEGSLRYRTWDDSETGKKRSAMDVRADRIEFLGAPPTAASHQAQAQGTPQELSANPAAKPPQSAPMDDDDIPF